MSAIVGAWIQEQAVIGAQVFQKMLAFKVGKETEDLCSCIHQDFHLGCFRQGGDLACGISETPDAIFGLLGHIYGIHDDEITCADAEDLVRIEKLYHKEGWRCINRLDGTFVLSIFDLKNRTLFLFKDRLGTKPLYYTAQKGVFLFSSSLRSILDSGMVQRQASHRALNSFLSYGYLPAPETGFEGIRQLLPGRVLIVTPESLEERCYWRFSYADPQQRLPNTPETVELFKNLLEVAVLRRLKKHPQAGAFLSGGLDTSVLAVVMKESTGSPFPVFTASFREEAYDETEDARLVADHLQLKFHTVEIDFKHDFPTLLERIVVQHEAPFADTSAIPSFFAAKLAREHVSTVLTGDFPDQLIGGSGHQVAALRRAAHDAVFKQWLRRDTARWLISKIPMKTEGRSLPDRVKRYLYRECFPLEEQRVMLSMPVPPLLKRALYTRDFLEVDKKFDPLEHARSLYAEVQRESLLNKILYFDVLSYAPYDLMVKVDRMCAAHGLNAISPFHDREIVDFVAALPEELKISGNERKVIMRRAFGGCLPARTLAKPKQGFAMPIGQWLVNHLSAYVKDVLLDRRTLQRGYFNPRFTGKLVEDFLAGKSDYASGSEATIICLLTLELWHRHFIDN